MNLLKTIANYVLALPFLVFGLNYFFEFLEQPEVGLVGMAHMKILADSGFLAIVKVMEILLAVMIFAGFKRPLAYVLLAPIAVGILMTELLILESPPMGILFVVLLAYLMYAHKSAYAALLK